MKEKATQCSCALMDRYQFRGVVKAKKEKISLMKESVFYTSKNMSNIFAADNKVLLK